MDDVARWLERHGLGRYAEAFADNDVDFALLGKLTAEDLKDLGFSVGHRRRFLEAAADLRVSPEPASAPGADPPRPAVADPRADAERRQLTVMFCDLVGSTELSTRLDPEELQEVMRAFQDRCAGAIARFDGFIARYMGDGLLVYFGFPRAHENEPDRAVRAALEIVEAMTDLSREVGAGKGVELAVRVGIATGTVVVGDIVGEGASAESAVVGETPNLAARLQGLAGPNQVILSDATHRLLREPFECESLGPQTLKGLAMPVGAWRAGAPAAGGPASAGAAGRAAAPLVGRQEELGLLVRAWETSKQGFGQVVLLRGDAGIGKSRLVDALREHVAEERHLWIPVRCSPYHAQSALYPVVEQIKRGIDWTAEDDEEQRLAKLERALAANSLPREESVPLVAELLSLRLPAERYPPLALTPAQKKRATLDVLSGWVFEEAERCPALQIWEDIHWADPTTLELLGLYIEQAPTASMLNVLTFRPDFVPPWPQRSHATPITLNRLEPAEVEALMTNLVGGRQLPREVVEHVTSKADGVPLFAEELTKSLLDMHVLAERGDRFEVTGVLDDMRIPATLQDALMSRLDRLPTVRELAQLGAVLGREFAYEMLRTLSGMDEPALREGLGQLVAAELLYQRGRPPRARYIFKHALIQDAAYQSLLKRSRQRFHRQVAELLEGSFPELSATQPELVAHHYAEAGAAKVAIDHWRRAAQRSVERSNYHEAVHCLDQALAQLARLPGGEDHDRRELELQAMKLAPLLPAKGYASPEVAETSARVLDLCRSVGDQEHMFPALYARWAGSYMAARHEQMFETSGDVIRLAREQDSDAALMVGLRMHAVCFLMRGKVESASDHARQALELYDPKAHRTLCTRFGQDPKVQACDYLSISEALRGNVDIAREIGAEGIAHARSLGHANTLAYALWHIGVWLSSVLREPAQVLALGEELLHVSREHGIGFWEAMAMPFMTVAGHGTTPDDAPLATEQALEAWRRKHRGVLICSQVLCHAGEAYLDLGRLEDARRVVEEAGALMAGTGEVYWEPEVYRLRGRLAARQGGAGGAAAEFEHATALARERGARLLEIRAATAHARHLVEAGRDADARALLEPVCTRFGEGLDCVDADEARAVLERLAG